jgi:hypothetical protein
MAKRKRLNNEKAMQSEMKAYVTMQWPMAAYLSSLAISVAAWRNWRNVKAASKRETGNQ